MNGQELKDALMKRCPVRYKGLKFDYVSAIIYRKNENGIVVTAELNDILSNYVVIASADKVEYF